MLAYVAGELGISGLGPPTFTQTAYLERKLRKWAKALRVKPQCALRDSNPNLLIRSRLQRGWGPV
jgi:hypothetical protein